MSNAKTAYIRPIKNNLTLIIEEKDHFFQWQVIRTKTKEIVYQSPIRYATLETAQAGYLNRLNYVKSI